MTCLPFLKDYIEEEGNVHTGGLPPWLQAEEDHDPDRAIGPTLEDFKKHGKYNDNVIARVPL